MNRSRSCIVIPSMQNSNRCFLLNKKISEILNKNNKLSKQLRSLTAFSDLHSLFFAQNSNKHDILFSCQLRLQEAFCSRFFR